MAHEEGEKRDDVAFVTAPITEAVQTGDVGYSFTTVPGWGKIPNNEYIGATHGGIVVDKAGKIYVSTDGENNLAVFNADGTFLKSLGKDLAKIHGMNIRVEGEKEFIYGAMMSKVVKIDLDGVVVMTITGNEENDTNWLKATAVAVAPNGDIFIADGYGSSVIYKYDKDGNFLKKIGLKGKDEGQFQTSHGLAIDSRNPEKPLLIVADRENRRLQVLDLDGNFIKVAITDLRRPCSMSISGDLIAIAELEGRVVLLDKDFKIVSKLGDNPNKKQWAKFPTEPKDWQGGIFTAPHGVSFDHEGNLYVMDWNKWGRITKLVKNK